MTDVTMELLRARWDSAMVASVNNSLTKGVVVSPFPPLADGRADLRGVVLKSSLKRVRIEAVDLSYMHWEWVGMFVWCTFRNCSFRMAELMGRLGDDIAQCDFSQAVFDPDGATILGGTFADCCFDGADMSKVLGSEVRFLRCTFRRSRMRRAQLTHTLFDHCDFTDIVLGSGSLGGSRFVGCRIPLALRRRTLLEGIVEEDA